ncbi:hypothetical protein D3C81_1314780 [compost metagenome]
MLEHALGDALPRDAVKTVAPGNVVTLQAVNLPVLLERQVRSLAFERVRFDIARRVNDRCTTGFTRLHQVTGHLGLAIDHHRLATGQGLEVQTLAAPADEQFDAFVHQAFTVHPRCHTGFTQQVDSALLKYTGTDAPEHVFGGLALDNDGLDTRLVQQLAEQQAGRTCTDDCNLSFHCCCL